MKFSLHRREFLQKSVIGISSLPFAAGASEDLVNGQYEIVNKTITIKNLPEVFNGFTIGMISDIHSSVFMNKEDMDEYVAAMNNLKPDLIVVAGDFVNSQTEEVYPFAEAFSQLKAPYGVYGCLGNHDYYTGNVDRVAKEVDNCGITLLRNDTVPIQKGNSLLNLIGVDDIGHGVDANDYLDRAIASVKNNQPKILLCHKPYYFQNANDRNIDLTLSGHTHGGQIVFGIIDKIPISFATLASKYVAGLYHLGNSQLYVNRGIGYVGIPVRINCPPELTKITLA